MSRAPSYELLNIRGIPVKFPFVPYKCQIDYMESVLLSLQEGKNAMLESPTGTGKTMCLLASSLAWREYKLNQLEQAQVALAEQANLLVDGDLTAEALEQQGFRKPRPPVIVYASRTHSQLAQVVSELHRTSYAASLNICVLGSRAQMCIHPIVSQVKGGVGAVNRTCAAYVRRSSCRYHTNSEILKTQTPKTRDIEDLMAWGRRREACPYYIAKNQQTTADIVFVPYNYIIDPLIRRTLTLELKGAVVILDEAHNLENVANDAASFELSSVELKHCLTQIQQCIDAQGASILPPIGPVGYAARNVTASSDDVLPPLAQVPGDSANEQQVPSVSANPGSGDDDWTTGTADAAVLKDAVAALISEISSVVFPAGTNVKVSDGRWAFEIFQKIGITAETAPAFLRTTERVAQILADGASSAVQVHSSSSTISQVSYSASNALSSLAECLRKMFMTGVPVSEASQHFKAVIQRESSGMFTSSSSNNSSSTASSNRGPFDRQFTYKLSFWCFYPGLAMQSLMGTGIRSLIVTSGTLSPLNSFAYELGISFPIRLENPHVIPTSQIWVGVLCSAVDGEALNSAYTNRSDQYKKSLGLTLINIARITPGGLLIFFPSYRMMEECIEIWRAPQLPPAGSPSDPIQPSNNIWDQLCRYKQPVVEPRESSKLKQAMKDYYEKVDRPVSGELNGAMFLAVCRGKVSEGLDFSDKYGRTVVVTGLPFAQNMDQKVKLKREYLDNQAQRKSTTRAPAIMPSSASGSSNTTSIGSSSTPDNAKADSKASVAEPDESNGDKPLTGAEWYAQSAWRAVNQAIGRVIRHRNDYGAIIFADERFAGSAGTQLSKWLRPHVHTVRSPGPAFQAITKFFSANAEKFTVTPNTSNSASSSSSEPVSSESRSSLVSHVASANARRKSVFDSLSSANSKSTASTTPTPTTASSNKPTNAEKSANAARMLALAKAQLSPADFQTFQTTIKQFKNRKMDRSERQSTLDALLVDKYPEVYAALRDYLEKNSSKPQTTEAGIPGSTVTAPAQVTSPLPASKPLTTLSATLLHARAGASSEDPTASRMSTSASASKSAQQTTSLFATATSLKQVPAPHPMDSHPELPLSNSVEIISTPITKKRHLDTTPNDEPAPAAKRFSPLHASPTAPSTSTLVPKHPVTSRSAPLKPAALIQPPTDSILDLSTSQPFQADVSPPPSTSPRNVPTAPSLEIIENFQPKTQQKEEDSSLQLVSVSVAPREVEDVVSDLPSFSRRSSSDVASRQSAWVQGLTRGSSGGLPTEVPTPAASSSASTAYATPKKHQFVDLITGRVTGTPPKAVPRTSPPKPAASAEAIPAESTLIDSQSSQGTECPICAKKSTDFRTAACGHSCCMECWQGWLSQKLECPFCRGRVRVKKLEKTSPK